jgi:cytochrome c-type biogenesis protein CcmH/NrfG
VLEHVLKEVSMLRGFRLAMICVLVALAAYLAVSGCATMGPKRAPLASMSDSMDVDTRTDALERMAQDYPDDPEVFFALGNVYYDQFDAEHARLNYEKAISLAPKMIKARVNLAMLIAESGQPDSARVMLEDVVKAAPRDSRALTNLGMVYYNLKDVDSAVKYYTMALQIDPNNPEAHYNLGVAFAEAGLLLEAIREWREVEALGGEDDTAQRARLALERAEGVLTK